MCTLISRGDLQPPQPVFIPSPPRPDKGVQPPEVEQMDVEECVQEGDTQVMLPTTVSVLLFVYM